MTLLLLPWDTSWLFAKSLHLACCPEPGLKRLSAFLAWKVQPASWANVGVPKCNIKVQLTAVNSVSLLHYCEVCTFSKLWSLLTLTTNAKTHLRLEPTVHGWNVYFSGWPVSILMLIRDGQWKNVLFHRRLPVYLHICSRKKWSGISVEGSWRRVLGNRISMSFSW